MPYYEALVIINKDFYDAEMIAHATSNNRKPTIDTVTDSEVTYVLSQLKSAGIPIPAL